MDRLAGTMVQSELYGVNKTDNYLRSSLMEFGSSYSIESSICFGMGKACKEIDVKNSVVNTAFIDNDDNYIVGLLGEIFNIEDVLKKYPIEGMSESTKIESIINRLFSQYNTDIFFEFNGEYAIAIWEKNAKVLYLISDHLGTRPIYYCCNNRTVAFDSDINALIHNNFCDSEIDSHGVLELLTFEYIFKDRTLYKNIKLIPAGTITKIKANDISFQKYFDIKINESTQKIDLEETVQNFYYKIKRAVEMRLSDDKPLGIPLSGGLDSRTLAAIANDFEQNVVSAAMGFEQCYDRIAGSAIAEILGFKHLGITFDKSEIIKYMEKGIDIIGGLTNAKHYQIFQIINELSRYVSVTFDGITPMGHNIIKVMTEAGRRSKNVNHSFLSCLNHGFSIQDIRAFSKDDMVPDAYDYLYQLIDEIREKNEYKSIAGQSHAIYLKQRCRRFTIQGDQILRTAFINRRPFMDKEVVAYWMGLPENMKNKYRVLKRFFIKFYPVLAGIVYTGSGMPLSRPESIVHLWEKRNLAKRIITKMTKSCITFLNKKSFFDYSEFFSSILEKSPKTLIPSKNSPIYNYIEPAYIKKMAQEHLSGKVLHTESFGLIFTLNRILSR
jgi:asparagine synthetase B (glutamine-hydrolysing)